MTPDYLLSNLESVKADKEFFINSFKSVVSCSLVKEFTSGNDRPCEINDFENHLKYCENDMKAIKLIFQNLRETNFFFDDPEDKNAGQHPIFNYELLTLLCILCGENSCVKPWNSEPVVKICSLIMDDILKLCNCSNTSELFCKKFSGRLIRSTLETIRPKLLSSTWKNFPAAVMCYKWILQNLKGPDLSSNLPIVVPTSLLLVDDFVQENRILGIECLNHIILNTTASELQFCSYGDVIFSALEPLLRIREPDLLNSLIPCLTNLSTKLEIDFGKTNKFKWSKFDCLLEIYLENMEMEQFVDLRNVYIKYLELLIKSSGPNIWRWTNRLLRIFREYSQVASKQNDENTIHHCLDAIEKFYIASEKLVEFYAENLFVTLLMIFHSTVSNLISDREIENRNVTVNLAKKLHEKMPKCVRESVVNDLKEKIEQNDCYRDYYKEICKTMDLEKI